MAEVERLHPNIRAVQRMLGGLHMLERDPKLKLTKPQAKSVLAVLNAWRAKPVMTNAQAGAVNKQLTASLTQAQRPGSPAGRRGQAAPAGWRGERPRRHGPTRRGEARRPRRSRAPGVIPTPREYNP